MRRFLVCLILGLVAVLPSAGMAGAQTAPQFKLGFATLAQLVPGSSGLPVENEHSDALTGDSIQRTTTGVMVWRKSDNVTAFTNGSTTWLLGPFGLQSRPNSDRFGWETSISSTPAPPSVAGFQPASPPVKDALSPGDVTVRFSRSGNSWVGDGSVRNSQQVPVDAQVDFIGYDATGKAVIDTPTVFVVALPPGASKSFKAQVPAVADVSRWETLVASWPVASRAAFSMDVGTSNPLKVDPALADAVNALKTIDDGSWLLKVAADHQIAVSEDYTGRGILGSFDPETGDVTISTDLEDTSSWARASVLAHELSHANNAAAGINPSDAIQCYREEAQAFTRQSQIWIKLWGSSLPSDRIDEYHAELNDIANTVTKDPQGFASQLVTRYRSECGPIGSGSTGAIMP